MFVVVYIEPLVLVEHEVVARDSGIFLAPDKLEQVDFVFEAVVVGEVGLGHLLDQQLAAHLCGRLLRVYGHQHPHDVLPAVDLAEAPFVDLSLVDDAADLDASHDEVLGLLGLRRHLLAQAVVLFLIDLQERLVLLDFCGPVVLEQRAVVADHADRLFHHLDVAVAQVVHFQRLAAVQPLVLEKLFHISHALDAVVHFAGLALLLPPQLQLQYPLRELLRHLPKQLADRRTHEFIIILAAQAVAKAQQREVNREVGSEYALAVEFEQ